jgi:pilus assembly protein Flp/PilA
MNTMALKTLLRDDSAQNLIEYALIAALVSLGAIASLDQFASAVSSAFSTVSSGLSSAIRGRH